MQGKPPRPTWHRATLTVCAGVLILLAACATPIQVERVNPGAVQRELTSNVISSGQISPETQIVLQQRDLWQLYKSDPETAIAILHRTVVNGEPSPDAVFALAEMSFRYAEHTDKNPYYLAAAIYAFTFLFPNDPTQRPNEFDPRVPNSDRYLQPQSYVRFRVGGPLPGRVQLRHIRASIRDH